MIRELTIKKFRGFQHFEMQGLGRVNLLVGSNNSGKTSVLEAVQLLASRGDPGAIWSTTARRGETLWGEHKQRPSEEADVSHLFYGHEIEEGSLFSITGGRNSTRERLTVEIRSRELDDDSQAVLFEDENDDEKIGPFDLLLDWNGIAGVKLKIPISQSGGLPLDPIMRRSQQQKGAREAIHYAATASLHA